MTLLAMLFMGLALIAVTALLAWCYWQVLRHPDGTPPRPSDD